MAGKTKRYAEGTCCATFESDTTRAERAEDATRRSRLDTAGSASMVFPAFASGTSLDGRDGERAEVIVLSCMSIRRSTEREAGRLSSETERGPPGSLTLGKGGTEGKRRPENRDDGISNSVARSEGLVLLSVSPRTSPKRLDERQRSIGRGKFAGKAARLGYVLLSQRREELVQRADLDPDLSR